MTGPLLVLSGLAVILLGLSAGIHLCGVAALNPALRALDGPVYLAVKQSTDRYFPALMRPLTLAGIGVLLGLTVLAAIDGRSTVAALDAVGLIAGLVALLGVLRGDLPINLRMADWVGDHLPSDWRTWQARWERWFRLRTVATGVSFLATLAGLVALP
ncbi:hypothetical protein JL107_04130 [Nakamurella flavida]|uniref:DUF1772 domain-containing protein n=1 Tax=Nakamurella flavida TaxID=363630 RepID=A0A938YIA8_9ACTN|nr:hypothetical protein [Nakamurella flavida]MBM9475629.1 hypothetical protein [Nakamurella flavida]MDP9778095.1 hypothetical protein [Nakamurella flavida]